MKNKFLILTLSILTSLFAFSCKSDKTAATDTNEKTEETTDNVVKKPMTALFESAPYYKIPTQVNKEYGGKINLGEIVMFLGEEAIDTSSDKKYNMLKMELSDGKVGWIRDYYVAKDSKPAVVIKSTTIFDRPTAVAMSDKNIDQMNVVAIVGDQDDWYEVAYSSGWARKTAYLHKDAVSDAEEDLVVAVIYKKIMAKKNEENQMDLYEDFFEKTDSYKSSALYKSIKEEYDELMAEVPTEESEMEAVEEEIEVEEEI